MPPFKSVKLLDQLRERIRYLHYSLRIEEAYVHCRRAFIRFHGIHRHLPPSGFSVSFNVVEIPRQMNLH